MPEEPIISPDVHRANRIPPRQALTPKWPILHAGLVPKFNAATWDFAIVGLVEQKWKCTYAEFQALPRVRVKADFHCVTRWSKLDNVWEGVSTKTLMSQVKIDPRAKFVMVYGEPPEPGDAPFSTNMPLADFLGEDCLFAWNHNGEPLTPDHGYPLRLVIPRLYAWKSAKWVRGIELMEQDRPGFWEHWTHGGYHMHGDPWKEERFN